MSYHQDWEDRNHDDVYWVVGWVIVPARLSCELHRHHPDGCDHQGEAWTPWDWVEDDIWELFTPSNKVVDAEWRWLIENIGRHLGMQVDSLNLMTGCPVPIPNAYFRSYWKIILVKTIYRTYSVTPPTPLAAPAFPQWTSKILATGSQTWGRPAWSDRARAPSCTRRPARGWSCTPLCTGRSRLRKASWKRSRYFIMELTRPDVLDNLLPRQTDGKISGNC